MRGGPRVDPHGQPVGEMTREQMARAAERLKALAEKKKRKVHRPRQSHPRLRHHHPRGGRPDLSWACAGV